jgi:hypothetical protein
VDFATHARHAALPSGVAVLAAPLSRKRVVPASVITNEALAIERAIEFAHYCIASIRETGLVSGAPIRWEHVQYDVPRFAGDIGDLFARDESGATPLTLHLQMFVSALPDGDVLFVVGARPSDAGKPGPAP